MISHTENRFAIHRLSTETSSENHAVKEFSEIIGFDRGSWIMLLGPLFKMFA